MNTLKKLLLSGMIGLFLCGALAAQTAPAQPASYQYAISNLYLFPSYADRAAYQAATGNQAPVYNPSLPLKNWEDPQANGKDQTYLVFDPTANPPISNLTVPAVASRVNLPGAYVYPAGVLAPTDGITESGPFGGIATKPDPTAVCLQSEVQAVATAITPLYPGLSLNVTQLGTGMYVINYGTDPRRIWSITFTGAKAPMPLAACALVAAQKHAGVGAPGHWGPGPSWILDPQVTAPPAGAVTIPTPIRALASNEQLVQARVLPGASPSYVIARTDIPDPTAVTPTSTDPQIQQILDLLNKIEAQLQALAAK